MKYSHFLTMNQQICIALDVYSRNADHLFSMSFLKWLYKKAILN